MNLNQFKNRRESIYFELINNINESSFNNENIIHITSKIGIINYNFGKNFNPQFLKMKNIMLFLGMSNIREKIILLI